MSNTNALSARDRITALVDENSFVEIGANITKRSTDFNMQEKSVPADGVITGYGLVQNTPVYIYSQDASALNGTIGEMHARKIAHAYELAMKTGVPVIGLIDCAGMRLQESTDALAGFGEIYRVKAKASGVVPQISAIFGNCGGGVAVLAAMSLYGGRQRKAFCKFPKYARRKLQRKAGYGFCPIPESCVKCGFCSERRSRAARERPGACFNPSGK